MTGLLHDIGTEDLDLLDDIRIHAYCEDCASAPRLGDVYTAACGQRTISRADIPPGVVPIGACAECVAVFERGCPSCVARL